MAAAAAPAAPAAVVVVMERKRLGVRVAEAPRARAGGAVIAHPQGAGERAEEGQGRTTGTRPPSKAWWPRRLASSRRQ